MKPSRCSMAARVADRKGGASAETGESILDVLSAVDRPLSGRRIAAVKSLWPIAARQRSSRDGPTPAIWNRQQCTEIEFRDRLLMAGTCPIVLLLS